MGPNGIWMSKIVNVMTITEDIEFVIVMDVVEDSLFVVNPNVGGLMSQINWRHIIKIGEVDWSDVNKRILKDFLKANPEIHVDFPKSKKIKRK
jgi:hypothetical protein